MKGYLVKTPKIISQIFPKRIWSLPNESKTVYLTFDDGPVPEATPWVLEQLKKHNAKATFFCVGNNVARHPDIFKKITAEGHNIGNHTYYHPNGHRTKYSDYIADVVKGENEIQRRTATSILTPETTIKKTTLFRPPYGKLTSRQSHYLQKRGYKIIMWDVLSADFDNSISQKNCLQNVLKNIEEGSIVVFHDSIKAEKNLKYTLPKVLDYIKEKGWKSEAISD